ncbi:MAG TPA: hypothetical protein VGJ00_07030 [Rhabdochlamydiaceae bacterium]|jgi:hypothetical protein
MAIIFGVTQNNYPSPIPILLDEEPADLHPEESIVSRVLQIVKEGFEGGDIFFISRQLKTECKDFKQGFSSATLKTIVQQVKDIEDYSLDLPIVYRHLILGLNSLLPLRKEEEEVETQREEACAEYDILRGEDFSSSGILGDEYVDLTKIEGFDAFDENLRIACAKITIDNWPADFFNKYSLYQITDKSSAFDLIKYAAKRDGEVVIKNLKKLGLDEEERFKVACEICKGVPRIVCENLPEFDFGEEKYFALLKKIAETSGRAFTDWFCHFRIRNQQECFELVTIAAQQDPVAVSEKFHIFSEKFHIFNLNDLIHHLAIAKIVIVQSAAAYQHIAAFNISSEQQLALAREAAKIHGREFSEYMQLCSLPEAARLELAYIVHKSDSIPPYDWIVDHQLGIESRILFFAHIIRTYPEAASGYSDILFPEKEMLKENYPELGLFSKSEESDIPGVLSRLENTAVPKELIQKLEWEYALTSLHSNKEFKTAKMRMLVWYASLLEYAKDCEPLIEKCHECLNDLLKIDNPYVQTQKLEWIASIILSCRAHKIPSAVLDAHWALFETLNNLRDPDLRASLSASFIQKLLNPSLFAITKSQKSKRNALQLVFMQLALYLKKIPPYVEVTVKLNKMHQCVLTTELVDFDKRVEELLNQKFFRNQEQIRILLQNLQVVLDCSELSEEEKISILRDLIFAKDRQLALREPTKQSQQVLRSAQICAQLVQCGAIERLTSVESPQELQEQLQDLPSNVLHIDAEEFNDKFFDMFGTFRQSGKNAIFTYANKLNTLSDKEEVLPFLKNYVLRVLNRTFKTEREDPTASEHTLKIYSEDPELWRNWNTDVCFEDDGSFQVIFGADACDLLVSGTEVSGSCLNVNLYPEKNKCLLAYLLDGKIRMMSVKNKKGTIIARCMVYLLWEEKTQQFVLFQSYTYPDECLAKFSDMLDRACLELAHVLKRPLYNKNGEQPSDEGVVLKAFKGSVPYEYVDGIDDRELRVCKPEGYEIDKCRLTYISL